MIFEKAYAKINLALEVGKKINGYHEVKNLMVPISLHDELFFQKSVDTKIDCQMEIENNICLKAVKLFKEKFSIEEGVTIILNKKIPVMAGLAGGSTDAAATLRGLNRLFEVNASNEELEELASQLGSDVPFFLYNKPALCVGRGEIIKPLDIDFKDVPFLLIKPKFGLSTKEVYMNYKYDNILKNHYIENIKQAMIDLDISKLDANIFNDLEHVALSLKPELKELFEKIESLSYIPHISGSGPSIFILDAKAIDLENIKQIDDNLELFLCHTI